MRINNNIMALNAHRQLGVNQAGAAKSMEKLSSGLRINRAGDDAAGLAISEKMRGQIRGLKQASRNAQDGISLIQTAEGNLNESHAILQRMRELANQAASDTNVKVDREEIQKEMNQLTSELNRIGNTTEFNTMKLLNGGGAGVLSGVANVAHQAAGGTDAAATATVDGVTFTASENGIDFNDYTITFADNTTEGVVVDRDAKTIVVSLDFGDTPTNASGSWVVTATGAGSGTFTVSGTFTGNAASTGTTSGGSSATPAVAGSTSFSIASPLKVGDTLAVGGNTVTVYADNAALAAANGGSGDTYGISLESASTVDAQAAAIRGMTFTDVTVSGTGSQVVLTQTTAGTGDVTGPVLTAGGKGYNAVLQIGANTGQSFTVQIDDMRAEALGISTADNTAAKSVEVDGKTYAVAWTTTNDVTNGTDSQGAEYALDVSNHDNATAAIQVIDDAIGAVSSERSKLGAMQNRLEHTITNLGTSAENMQAAESRIRDLDMAEEIMAFTKNNILQQAATAMLAQANMAPQSVLQLLG